MASIAVVEEGVVICIFRMMVEGFVCIIGVVWILVPSSRFNEVVVGIRTFNIQRFDGGGGVSVGSSNPSGGCVAVASIGGGGGDVTTAAGRSRSVE